MALQPFTRNFEDSSTDAGFQFTFYCDHCQNGYRTEFRASKTYKKRGLFRGIGQVASIGAYLGGQHGIDYAARYGSDVLSERFEGMSPEWHKEHEEAFRLAQNEAMGHFHRCPSCAKWVCDNDWNEEEGLCVSEAPRLSSVVAQARSEKMVEDVKKKAAETQVFTGDIDSRTTICPACGKPAGNGKFCNNCGADLNLNKCLNCGAQNAQGVRFCGECGNRIG